MNVKQTSAVFFLSWMASLCDARHGCFLVLLNSKQNKPLGTLLCHFVYNYWASPKENDSHHHARFWLKKNEKLGKKVSLSTILRHNATGHLKEQEHVVCNRKGISTIADYLYEVHISPSGTNTVDTTVTFIDWESNMQREVCSIFTVRIA